MSSFPFLGVSTALLGVPSFSFSLSLSLSLSFSLPLSFFIVFSFSSRLLLGAAVKRIAERDMAAGEKYPFAKAVSFGRASRRHCVARWRRRRLRTLSPITRLFPTRTGALLPSLSLSHCEENSPSSSSIWSSGLVYIRTHAREREKAFARVCVSL